MNRHATCGTCIFNEGARCACEDSRYKGCTVKSWNTCSAHTALPPTPFELLSRLAACSAALDHLAAKAPGEYRDYYADRAAQCRKWKADLSEVGRTVHVDYIVAGLEEFEAMAL